MINSTHKQALPSQISMKSENSKYLMYQKLVASNKKYYVSKSDRKYSSQTQRSQQEKQSSLIIEEQNQGNLRRTNTTNIKLSPKKYTKPSKSQAASPYLLHKTQKITKIMKTVPNQAEQEKQIELQIPIHTLEHLKQFISHCLAKTENPIPQKQPLRNNYAKELEQLQEQVRLKKQQAKKMEQECKNQKQENIKRQQNMQEQYKDIQEEIKKINIQILIMISVHSNKKDEVKNLKKMETELLNKISYHEMMAKQQIQIKSQKLENQLKLKSYLVENSNRMQYEISLIKKLRESVKDKAERIRVGNKMQKSLYVLYDQLIKQKSLKDMKSQMQSTLKVKPQAPSNKQVLQQFYKSISKKLQLIKNAVISHNETHQFLSDLQLQQETSGGLFKLNKQSLSLNQQQKKTVKQQLAQMNVYRQYFKSQIQFKRIIEELDKISTKYEDSLQASRIQIENIKKAQENLQKKIVQLQGIEVIREAEAQTLNSILKEKKSSLDKSKIRVDRDRDGYQIFRNSIANFVKKKSTI